MLERIQPGDRTIPAKTFNAIADAVESIGLVGHGLPGSPFSVLARNDTGDVLTFGSAVGISAPLFELPQVEPTTDQSEEEWLIEAERFRHFADRNYIAVLPTEETTLGVTLAPIASGEVGPVALTGVARAIVDVKDTDHETITFTAGSTGLESSESGTLSFLIKPTATGKQWCDLAFGVSGGGAPQRKCLTGRLTASVNYDTPYALVELYRTFNDKYPKFVLATIPQEFIGFTIRTDTPVVLNACEPYYSADSDGSRTPSPLQVEWMIYPANYVSDIPLQALTLSSSRPVTGEGVNAKMTISKTSTDGTLQCVGMTSGTTVNASTNNPNSLEWQYVDVVSIQTAGPTSGPMGGSSIPPTQTGSNPVFQHTLELFAHKAQLRNSEDNVITGGTEEEPTVVSEDILVDLEKANPNPGKLIVTWVGKKTLNPSTDRYRVIPIADIPRDAPVQIRLTCRISGFNISAGSSDMGYFIREREEVEP